MIGMIMLLLVIILVGAVAENMDRAYFVNGTTHMGFITGQSAKKRLWVAIALVAVMLILLVIGGGKASTLSFEMILLAIPLLMLGFVAGPMVGKLWGRKDEFLKTVEKLQSDPDAAVKTRNWFVDLMESFFGAKKKPAQAYGTYRAQDASQNATASAAAPAAAAPKASEPKPSADDVVNDFTGKH